MKLVVPVLAALTIAACTELPSTSALPTTSPALDPATLATITGKVLVDGNVPAAKVIRMDGDPKCVSLAAGEARRAENVVLGNDKALQNALVYVKDGLPPRMYPIPAEPVVLDQEKCRYVPRVLGIQVGQQLLIKNSDPLLHNVRAEAVINEPFDIGTPVQGVEATRTFATREVMVPFKCNVHSWMNAYIGVLEHPYFAVSDAQGRFTLPPLPAGTYTIEMWHEHFGTDTQQITVGVKETKELTFTYKAS